MTKEQRLEIESILCKVFEGFTDERLKGKYYSMATDVRRGERKIWYDLQFFLTHGLM